jgi:hypothetical protein
MHENSIYLYGFVPPGIDLDLSMVVGVETAQPVRALEFAGTTAIIGEVSLEAFDAAMSAGPDGGPDPAWIIPQVLRHEAVLDKVLTRSPVLPARFGALFSSRDALAELVSEHQGPIAGYFEAIGDRLEWSIRGYFEPSRAIEHQLQFDPDLSRRQASLPMAAGTRYFLEKRLREEARLSSRRSALQVCQRIRHRLKSITRDSQSLPLRDTESPRREMLLHETFLLSAEGGAETLSRLRETVGRDDGILVLESSGPWPPFHFCPALDGGKT